MVLLDYELDKSRYAYKGVAFFCASGFSIGCLILGFYGIGLGGVLFSGFSHINSKVFGGSY